MNLIKILGGFILLISVFAFSKPTVNNNNVVKVKCLLQTTNYSGEGAYIVVSLIDNKGNYVKTLYMQGQDEKWYDTLKEWWKNIGETATNIDEISGATITPGARSIINFNIPEDKLNKGYSLRFESAVEDKDYFEKDVEIDLNKENLKGKFNGNGYIRYVRLIFN
ncbi:DUF2271 domain-containing protein [Wenyingzhuangia sp. IMCC45467]